MGLPLARIDDQYEIVAKIKEGGMGEIYKVRHRLLDEIRVVKVLHSKLEGDNEINERFAREARAAIQLRHPNIVQIFDFTLDASGTGLIVMEYIHGSDLKQLIAQPERPSVALALEIARQGLRALGYLHRHGFVHRDVSPDNLMLSQDVEGRPLVKVIDLGIAKRRGIDPQLTASGMFLGKFRYSSPEHFGVQGPDGIEARSDLYTFGLVLYELLTGQSPIRGESTSQLIAGHLFQPPRDFGETDPDRRIPEALRRIVLKTLAKAPVDRHADADELIAELEGLQAEFPLSHEVLEESRRFSQDASCRPADSGAAPAGTAATAPATPAGAAEEMEPGSGSHVRALFTNAQGLHRAGQIELARAQLEAILEIDAAHAGAHELLATIEAETAERSAALDTLVEQVDTLLSSGKLAEASRVLVQAQETHGSTTELTTMRSRLEKLSRQTSEKDERELVEETERRLVVLIQRQELVEAREMLAAAQAEAGSDEAFEPLRQLLSRTVDERLRDLVKEAGVAYEAQDFETAGRCLGQALELDPDNSWLRDRLAQARAGRRRQEEQARREQSRAGELAAISDLIDAEDLEAATRRLHDAVTRLGSDDAFTRLGERLAELRREVEARHHLQEAREAWEDHDILKARLLVARVLELKPGDHEAAALAKTLDREHRSSELQRSSLETRPLEPALARAFAEIETLRSQGDAVAAWRLLGEAIERFGEIDTFTRLRRLIAEEILSDGDPPEP